jgi:hypothetical protein
MVCVALPLMVSLCQGFFWSSIFRLVFPFSCPDCGLVGLSKGFPFTAKRGGGAVAAEFEAFRAALNCASCAKEALYGRNLRLMRVDFEAAFTSSLRAYQSGVPCISGSEGLRESFMIETRPDVDFEKIERLLPADEPLQDVR